MNEYTGYHPLQGAKVDVEQGEITPSEFFNKYVKPRRPIVLPITADLQHLPSSWTNEFFKKLAGDTTVEVEQREDSATPFGRGNTCRVPFSEFLTKLENGSENMYLTTQKIRLTSEGQPDIMSSPLKEMFVKDSSVFPLPPKLLGNLIPMNLNIWMGRSSNGASSGLHHDYHDNLYVLLRGKKQFRLFSPKDTERMYTRGKVMKVHSNGRINYEEFPTLADGSEPGSWEALQRELRKQKAEAALADAEECVARGDPGADAKLKAAEEMVEKVMDELLEADDEDDFDTMEQDEEESRNSKKPRIDCDPTQVPLNFSTVDNLETPGNAFPFFKQATPVTCSITSGSMLYLPAGWFHEVTSFNDSDSQTAGHLAFNYWMHPPDNGSFENPYSCPYWPEEWKLRGL